MTTQREPFEIGARWCFITACGDRRDYAIETADAVYVNVRTGEQAWATRTWLTSRLHPRGSR